MNCLLQGVIEIDHITIADLGVSTTPLVLITMCTPRLHDAYYVGNPSKSGNTCDQDAIRLGGTNLLQISNDITSAFAGYGGYVRGNGFSRIRRAVWGGNFVNNIIIEGNNSDTLCGSDQAVDAPYVLDSGGSDAGLASETMGNLILGNTIEMMGSYSHGVWLQNNALRNVIRDNGFWDVTAGKFVSDIRVDEANGCITNDVIQSGYSNTYSTSGMVAGAGKNYLVGRYDEWHQRIADYRPAGYVMHLNGDAASYVGFGYHAECDGPRLYGWNGWAGKSTGSGDGLGGQINFSAGTAAPLTGAQVRGAIRYNIAPSELGTAAAKYVITGWICTVAGTPGTWLPMRTLTGN